jgi:hypothetical protein
LKIFLINLQGEPQLQKGAGCKKHGQRRNAGFEGGGSGKAGGGKRRRNIKDGGKAKAALKNAAK